MNPKLEALELAAVGVERLAPDMVQAATKLLGESTEIPTLRHCGTAPKFVAEHFLPESVEASVFERVRNSVVRISALNLRLDKTGEVPKLFTAQCSGTGFLLDGDLVATNYHVVRERLFVPPKIILHDGTRLACQLLARDKVADVAILKIVDKPSHLQLETAQLAPRHNVLTEQSSLFCVGHPKGVPEATMGSGIMHGMENWQSGKALSFLNPKFKSEYSQLRDLLGPNHPSWIEENSLSIRVATVQKLRTTLPSFGGASGSPVFDDTGTVRGIITSGNCLATYATHIDHLNAIIRRFPPHEIQNGWLDVTTKASTAASLPGEVSVYVTNAKIVPWSKTVEVSQQKIAALNEFKLPNRLLI